MIYEAIRPFDHPSLRFGADVSQKVMGEAKAETRFGEHLKGRREEGNIEICTTQVDTLLNKDKVTDIPGYLRRRNMHISK